jgi:hypothetical protein
MADYRNATNAGDLSGGIRKEPSAKRAHVTTQTEIIRQNSRLVLALDPERLKFGVALVHVVMDLPGNAHAERLVGLAELKKRVNELEQQARTARLAYRGAVTDPNFE